MHELEGRKGMRQASREIEVEARLRGQQNITRSLRLPRPAAMYRRIRRAWRNAVGLSRRGRGHNGVVHNS